MQPIEKMLDDAFKKAPLLPEEARKGLAVALPWLTLVGGVLSLLGAWAVYQAVMWTDQLAGYANSLYSSVGYASPMVGTVGVVGWVSLVILLAQAVLFFVAFPALRSGKKSGWDMLLWAALASVVYSVISNVFSGYFRFGELLFSLIGSAAGLYLLFQVRSYFIGATKSTTTVKPVTPEKKTEKK